MKTAIVIDDWKRPIFEERLTAAEFNHTVERGPVPKSISIFITIKDDQIDKLVDTVAGANELCKQLSETKGRA